MKLAELIERLGGELLAGGGELALTGVASSEVASGAQLVFAENEAQVKAALQSRAGAIVLREVVDSVASGKAVVQAQNPRLWFAKAARLIRDEKAHNQYSAAQVHSTAVIGEGVKLGKGTRVDAGVVIGDGVEIGEGCRVFPRVSIYEGTKLGNRVTVHSGVVLGADGFGYVRDAATGEYTQFPQQGTLVIEDDVEIGANSTIDRGALGETRIGRGTKIDNLVHIGHNCKIGEDVIIVALTGISGSCTVGDGAVIAGQVGLGDHVTVGEGVILGGQAGVYSNSKVTLDGRRPGTVFAGTPAKPLQEHLRELATLARLAKKARTASSE
jgi:UDP-3-O-[3-hydroxymyristoyl] glucosamine N-acyltransferase